MWQSGQVQVGFELREKRACFLAVAERVYSAGHFDGSSSSVRLRSAVVFFSRQEHFDAGMLHQLLAKAQGLYEMRQVDA